jgi:hypothetical protein
MEAPLVTIAIPTYNRSASYLKPALESALGQSYRNIEVLVSDNCSADTTPELVASFSDPRLRYHRQKQNIGQRPNMNFLVEHARGDYFLMFHDDDQIDPDFIETCVNAAEGRRDVGLIVTGSRVIDRNGTVVRVKENRSQGVSTDDFILSWYEKRLHLFLCCCLFGTAALRRAGGFEAEYGHFDDVAAEFKCASAGGRVDVSAIKASLRDHPGSVTRAASLNAWCRGALALLDLAISLAPSKRRELRSVGRRTSAERNYRLASQLDSRWAVLGGFWTVFKAFGFRHSPPPNCWYAVSPLLGRLLQPRAMLKRLGGAAARSKGKR